MGGWGREELCKRLTLGEGRGDNGEVAAFLVGEAAAGMLVVDVAAERASMRGASGVVSVGMAGVVRPLEHPRVRMEVMTDVLQASGEVCLKMLRGGATATANVQDRMWGGVGFGSSWTSGGHMGYVTIAPSSRMKG